jgi:hypothetical protein
VDPEQFEEIVLEMQMLHRSMKNMMEFVFACSPLLALSTTGWAKSISGAYLLRVSDCFNVFVDFFTHLGVLTAFHCTWE